MSEVSNIIKDLSIRFPWFHSSIKEFDVTIVGNEYSLKDMINDASDINL